MSDSEAGPSRARMIVLGVALVVLMALAALAVRESGRRDVEARLMALRPNQVPSSPALFAYARDQGQRTYAANCVSCHGADLQGDPARGVPKLSDRDWLYGGGMMADLERTISYGIRADNPRTWKLAAMPAFASADPHSTTAAEKLPQLTSQEISDLTDYVLTLSHRPADPAAAARGKEEFAGEGECYDCHVLTGVGDPDVGAPDLTDAIWLYGTGSRADIQTSIAGGRRGVCPAWLDRLGPVAVRGLAAFIKSRSRQSPYAVPVEELSPT